MKVLFWLAGLPLAAAAVLFALSNRQPVTVALWPFAEGLQLPLYLAILLPALAGYLLGLGLGGWGRRRGTRRDR
ncbi:MAG TPA: DUF1049 domain-containing protein [Rhodospirillaceae bacterium]|nr:DUF1049 domain-containing protein [Rhodospirillaceae bacterium]